MGKGASAMGVAATFVVPTRRSAMKSSAEEYGRILQVVQAYAIDNPGVSVSCRKGGGDAGRGDAARDEAGARSGGREGGGAGQEKSSDELLHHD